ncbi:zf-TFIIB domain-containing protein [Aeromicrobium sp. IC_218]|uniref:TFIIB-type zinc ribbon-containing protein n=1 Tax=Aeromicrobium sp. IC_218 TaxID=2545468 RepID=UPI00103C48D6|nr:zf-TFIIB domain-containing protein [Aeromicrobium sp. IC_218]TCI96944.1 hypothetical protein E0W78_12945 [Aeromicrobium sp. IC_218]
MKCPIDGATLTMSERSGIEIDYCPECRGVWLDRGELDKILDRVAAEAGPATPPAPPAPAPQAPPAQPAAPSYSQPPGYQQPQPAYGNRYYDDSDKRYYGGGGYKKRKGHWLGELFD